MSDADKAYEAAQRLIAEALEDGRGTFRLKPTVAHALTGLPPEISKLTKIERLDLNDTQITDITPIEGMSWVTALHLNNTQITDLTPLTKMKGITSLYLLNSRATDFTPLAKLKGITRLSLDNALIEDFTLLSGLTGMISLHLANAQITDLAPLTRMTKIVSLNLENTLVTDLRPLLVLKKLGATSSERGLSFKNIPANQLDTELAELSEIEDDQVRTLETISYLREVGDDWPPNQSSGIADRSSAAVYTFPNNGPIKSIDEPPSGGDEDQDDLREDLQQKVDNLIDTIGGSNELAPLREQAEHYQSRLGEDAIRIKLLWAAANALRQVYEKDGRAEVTARNTDLLPPKVSAALGDVVQTHALFIMGFENAAALERQMREGLTGNRNPEQLAAGTAIVTALDNRPDAIDADDYDALADNAMAAQGVGDSAEMAENDLGGRLWNLLGAAGRKARAWVTLGTKGGGTVLLGHDFIQFLIGNETLIMTYLRLAQGRAAEWFPKLMEAIRALLGA